MPHADHASPYDADFYASQTVGSYRSAQTILAELRQVLPFTSACDVGCGAGTWIKVLLESGLTDVIGIDGEYARGSLVVPAEHFVAQDLRAPISLERRFDLAMSLEVAEHLPAERSAGFVADLTKLAPAVLFSAAVPYQGGTDHINERWQSRWAEQFAQHKYRAYDLIRPRVWDNASVEVWYRQNTLLFLHEEHPLRDAIAEAARSINPPISLVHPAIFPLGYNMDNKALLLKFLVWSFARDLRRWRQRIVGR